MKKLQDGHALPCPVVSCRLGLKGLCHARERESREETLWLELSVFKWQDDVD
jgi:hypothetical protein